MSLLLVLKPLPGISCTCEPVLTASTELVNREGGALIGSAPLLEGHGVMKGEATVFISINSRGFVKAWVKRTSPSAARR